MKLSRIALTLTAFGALALPSVVKAQVPAFALTGAVSDFSNGSWAFGELFTVGPQNITVSSLGAYDAGGDGFATPGGIPVGIFQVSTSSLLTSTNVLSTDPLISRFRYDSIAPITLLSGQQYDLVAVSESDLYNINPGVTANPGITDNGYAYGLSTTLQQLSQFTGTNLLWMANMQIGAAQAAGTPEPGGIALLAGVGVSSVFAVARRRRK